MAFPRIEQSDRQALKPLINFLVSGFVGDRFVRGKRGRQREWTLRDKDCLRVRWNAFNEVAMWAVISACGRDAGSPGTTTHSSASPRLAISTSGLCWSSAPIMSLGRMEETRPYVSGACIWHRVEASSLGIEPSSPSLASSQYSFIASGSRKSRTSRSMQ
jgi:hypothetical protein